MAKLKAEEVRNRVILQQDGIIIIDKPAGFETIVKGGGNTAFCFTSITRRALGLRRLFPAHRLDRDTSGCQVFAEEEKTLAVLEKVFREKTAKKEYLALCLGIPKKKSGKINAPLGKWQKGREPVKVEHGKSGQSAETDWTLAAACTGKTCPFPQGASLIRFFPKTGRTHQVRVHAKFLGHPLIGDDNYSSRQANAIAKEKWDINRHALHARAIILMLPGNGKISGKAEIPEDMARALTGLIPGWQGLID